LWSRGITISHPFRYERTAPPLSYETKKPPMRYFGVDITRFILSKTKTVLPKQKSQVYLETLLPVFHPRNTALRMSSSLPNPLLKSLGLKTSEYLFLIVVRTGFAPILLT